MTRYPNLLELHRYHPYGVPVLCDHAGIEQGLLRAVLYEGEQLLPTEIRGIARLYGVSCGILECRSVTKLDMGRWRHRKMAAEIDAFCIKLKHMAREGNQEAERYLQWADREHQGFMEAAYTNGLSYCHYLGARKFLSQYIEFATPKPERRQLRRRNGEGRGADVCQDKGVL